MNSNHKEDNSHHIDNGGMDKNKNEEHNNYNHKTNNSNNQNHHNQLKDNEIARSESQSDANSSSSSFSTSSSSSSSSDTNKKKVSTSSYYKFSTILAFIITIPGIIVLFVLRHFDVDIIYQIIFSSLVFFICIALSFKISSKLTKFYKN